MGESCAVEDKKTYLQLNFYSGRKYGGICSKCLAVHVNDAHLLISGCGP